MNSALRPLAFIATLICLSSTPEGRAQKVTVIKMTGVRFAYPLIEHWIEEYTKVNPGVQLIIEWRGTNDPSQYDILVEAFEHPAEIRKERDYTYIGRYAILPVANSRSAFAKTYGVKGLTTETIRQIFFHDIFADKDNEEKITVPFTTYTRLQKAGAPIVFATYFKYEQKDIKGQGIAGSDEHLLKAVLRDTTGVSFLPTPVIYAKPDGVEGLAVIPVDLNGNDRVSNDEKFYQTRSEAIEHLTKAKDVRNLPIENIHLSVDRKSANPEALAFIRWVVDNRLSDLKDFGFLPSPVIPGQ
jgi:ABC-type phosphate transport system substrate-binding protein